MLEIREDPRRGNIVAGISEIPVTSTEEIMHTLRLSNRNRTTEPTEANETSSRSHGVL
jgi:kinesin family protein 18/19